MKSSEKLWGTGSARFPNSAGSGPVNSFQPRYSDRRLVRRPNHDGTGPVNALLPRDSCSRFARFPNSAGSGPVNSFQPRYSDRRLVRRPNHDGTGPVNALFWRDSHSRFARFPNSAGIGPVSVFSTDCCVAKSHRDPRFRFRRRASSPKAAGIGPANPLPGTSSLVTRPAVSIVTPNHSPSSAAVFQFVLSIQSGPPVAS